MQKRGQMESGAEGGRNEDTLVSHAFFNAERSLAATSLHDFQLADARPCESVLPFVPNAKKLLGVLCMNLVDVRRVRGFVLLDKDWVANDDVDGPTIGHEADVVVEDTCGDC